MVEKMKVYIDGVEQKTNALDVLGYLLDIKTGRKKSQEIDP